VSSTRYVDYSLRRNKAIERKIVFEGLALLRSSGCLPQDTTYVGLGSVWFVDFDLAHRNLGLTDLISIEADSVVAARARYNAPFRCVAIHEGYSNRVLPKLLADRASEGDTRPLIIWLDFDGKLDEDCLAELEYLTEQCPLGSVLITTVRTPIGDFGGSKDAVARARKLLGDAFPVENWPGVGTVPRDKEAKFCVDTGSALSTRLQTYAAASRPDSETFELFAIPYQDGTPMYTVGIGLFAPAVADEVRDVVNGAAWRGRTDEPVLTPPLTARESGALRSVLPAETALSRRDVIALGFDLEDDQLASFCKYYLDTPTFVETAR